MSEHLRLDPGNYIAETPVVLSLLRDDEGEKEWQEIPARGQFSVPAMVNRYYWALTYWPEYGDKTPRATRV